MNWWQIKVLLKPSKEFYNCSYSDLTWLSLFSLKNEILKLRFFWKPASDFLKYLTHERAWVKIALCVNRTNNFWTLSSSNGCRAEEIWLTWNHLFCFWIDRLKMKNCDMTPVKNKGINDSAFYAIELIIVKLKTSKCQQTIFQNNWPYLFTPEHTSGLCRGRAR